MYLFTDDGERVMSDTQLIYFLSSGTTKGILLYTLMVASLKEGFDLLIDEVEKHFHKTLVENMISLYRDKSVNRNNATLVFTTHYCEVLDLMGRQDGVQGKSISLDDVLAMMDIFAMPYKACILRLYECGVIGEAKTRELYDKSWKEVQDRILLTGKAKRWQLDGSGTELFGTLLEDFAYNCENEFLTESREKSDRVFISSLKDRYNLDVEGV